MIEPITENLYRIEVPLPQNPLKALNSYVIKGKERNLVIDTGMNREECFEALTEGLAELEIDLKHTDFFITHLHADHLGLVSRVATESSKIYISRRDAEYFESYRKGKRWEEQREFSIRSGFPEKETLDAITKHPGFRFKATGELSFTYLSERDRLEIADFQFRVIETPGHTPGHLCLYEKERKILISGDHILGRITPNISSWSGDEDPLSAYLASLDKTAELEVELVLPGHRHIFKDSRQRIQELKEHHVERAKEILQILSKSSSNAYNIAAQMTWDMTYKTWEEFPTAQKWFATGEAIAHLSYLETNGYVQKVQTEEGLSYSLRNLQHSKANYF